MYAPARSIERTLGTAKNSVIKVFKVFPMGYQGAGKVQCLIKLVPCKAEVYS